MDLSKIVLTKTVDTVKEVYKGVTFEIGRSGSDEFIEKMDRLRRPFKRQIEKNTIPYSKLRNITAKALAGTVLLGWENFKIDGKDVPFNEENASALLFNDKETSDFIVDIASSTDVFAQEDLEELKGK